MGSPASTGFDRSIDSVMGLLDEKIEEYKDCIDRAMFFISGLFVIPIYDFMLTVAIVMLRRGEVEAVRRLNDKIFINITTKKGL